MHRAAHINRFIAGKKSDQGGIERLARCRPLCGRRRKKSDQGGIESVEDGRRVQRLLFRKKSDQGGIESVVKLPIHLYDVLKEIRPRWD